MSETYPIVLLQDRYRGTYSGGAWLAIANASDLLDEKTTRAQFCLVGDDGPSDGDVEAARFWRNPPDWIAVGRTPAEAIEALEKGAPDPRVRAWRLGIKFEESNDR
jgi:hypothetical protein